MTASNTKFKDDEKTTKKINSIHIVVFACTNCGEEFEELRLCKECKSPMKVVQVTEKFGNEADEYLAKLKREGVWDDTSVHPKHDENSDGGIAGSSDELDDIDIKIAGQESTEETIEDLELGDIYPDDESGERTTKNVTDMDWSEALDKLDEEEDTSDLNEELPEL
ncbi:hypothetical protein IT417_02525 [bacterium]|nr:hypothetical protein [bacterium]